MKIHIFTLNWNGSLLLEKLEPGLIRNLKNTQLDYEWYIRDNGSKDESIKKINAWDNSKITVFDIGHNRDNFSQGVNYLFNKTATKDDDLILLLNNDVVFNDDVSLSNMLKLMTPDVGIVGARLLYPGTNNLQHAGVIFSERYNSMPYHFRHKLESRPEDELNRYFQCVTAACCFISALDFKNAGQMPEEMNWSFEDVLLNLRIGQLKKIAYCGNTNISHGESISLKKNPVNKLFLSKNVENFRKLSKGLYHLDEDKYLNNPNYNEIKTR